MILRKLRANFGKLHGELELHEGLNLLCLPNEAGKSTWSAFLLAMLYGIDTAERAGRQNQGLPAKERYRPWDGSPMEGSIELLWQGREITIQRQTQGRIPMGQFRAFETAGGTPVPELTGENCGRVLCGVERSVYERTAFIRQQGLAVTGDAALEQRLNALVTTGEEGLSYSAVEKELKALKNKYTYRTGLVPKLSGALQERQETLRALRAAQEEVMALTAERDRTAAQRVRLEALKTRVARARAAKRRLGLEELRRKADAQAQFCARLEEECAAFPPEDRLRSLQRELEQAENALRTAQMEAAFGAGDAISPPVSPYFTGLTGDEAAEKAAADVEKYERLAGAAPPKRGLPLLLCFFVMAAGAGLCFVSLLPGLAVTGAGVLALAATVLLLRRKTRAAEEQHSRARELLRVYGVAEAGEITALAGQYAGQRREYERRLAESTAKKQKLSAQLAESRSVLGEKVREVSAFAPDCKNPEHARDVLSASRRAWERLAGERRILDTLRQQCRSMELMLEDAEPAAPDEEALRYDPAEVDAALAKVTETLEHQNAQLAHRRGELSVRGDAVRLEAEVERLEQELTQAQDRAEAIELALTALERADADLRARFSPQITAEAGRLLSRLTEGKYARLLLEPDLRLSVREEDGAVMRPSAAMSCGTGDQMYLALRLAMCRRLLPDGVPMVLDDALVNFDDARARAALKVLTEEAQTRQVLAFTCRPIL